MAILFLFFGISASAIAFQDRDEARFELSRLLTDGREALERGDFEEAFASLDACVEIAPLDPRGHYWLGRARYFQAKAMIDGGEESGFLISATLSDAESALMRAIELSPEWPHPHAVLCRSLFAQNRLDEAVDRGRRSLELGQTEIDTYLDQVDALMILRQREQDGGAQGAADSLLDEAVDVLQLGLAHVREEARRRLLRIAPESHPPRLDGSKNAKPPSAERRIQQAGLAESYAALSRKLALAYWYQRKLDDAIEAYQRAVIVFPASVDAHADLYNFATSEIDRLESVLDFYRTLNEEPALNWWFTAQLHVSRAHQAYNGGDHSTSLYHYLASNAALRTSATLNREYLEDAEGMIALNASFAGWCYLQLEELELAEKSFIAAVEHDIELENARSGLDRLGQVYYGAYESKDKKLGDVRDYFERITAVVQDNADWWNNLGLFCRDTRQYEKSYEAYRRSAELSPDNPQVQNDCALILIYHLKRQLDEAEERCLIAIKEGGKELKAARTEEDRELHFTSLTDALTNLARLYYDQGRTPEAKTTIDELFRHHPSRTDAILLNARIEKKLAESVQ